MKKSRERGLAVSAKDLATLGPVGASIKAAERKRKHIHVFVGCGMQGDHCLYLKRGKLDGKGKGYLRPDELEEIAEKVEEMVNGKQA